MTWPAPYMDEWRVRRSADGSGWAYVGREYRSGHRERVLCHTEHLTNALHDAGFLVGMERADEERRRRETS